MSRNRNSAVTKELTREEKDRALVQELRDFHHFSAARRMEDLIKEREGLLGDTKARSGSETTSGDSTA